MKRILVILTVAALVPVLAACSQAPATTSTIGSTSANQTAGGQQVTIKALDTLRFDPDTITVKAGQPVTVTLQNVGASTHDFTLKEGVSSQAQVVVAGGQTGSTTFTINNPGTYTFFCSQPGHQQAGMVGKIVAQ